MDQDPADLASDIGKAFQKLAAAIRDHVKNNPISDDVVRAQLDKIQSQLLHSADQLFELSDEITFGTDPQNFSRVEQATKAINDNLATLKTTDKWLSFAAAVISLGTAILTGKTGDILPAAQTILSTFNIKSIPGTS
jgi:hypothetical protein